jgi:glutathione peroxidase
MRLKSLTPALLSLCLVAPLPALADCGLLEGESFRPLAGKEPVSLCERYEGQVLLVVNTASKCGFTPQYEGLEALHQELSGRGFSVVGFPSGDFMDQEFEDESQIAEFCTNTYAVKFPMFEKVSVKGEAAAPFFRELAEATGEAPGWNFHKYLLNREGEVVASFGSRTRPDDPALRAEIDRLLGGS